jgi:hypothetical protein
MMRAGREGLLRRGGWLRRRKLSSVQVERWKWLRKANSRIVRKSEHH